MGTMAIPTIPVGFRFLPTDMEVIDHYLMLRNIGQDFSIHVPDIDTTNTMLDPWQLPEKFKDELSYQGNDKDWWFFSPRTRHQNAVRITKSGKWSDAGGTKKITDGDQNQVMGIMTPFCFRIRQHSNSPKGKVQYTRFPTWKLYEYRLTDDYLDGFPLLDEETVYVLCHLRRDDKAKTDVEAPQTIGDEISCQSQTRQRKRTVESMEALLEPADIEWQIHPQDCLLSPCRPQGRTTFLNVQQLVESFGNDSSTPEPFWGSSIGNRSSGCLDFNIDILSNPREDQNALPYYDEQLETEMHFQDAIAESLGPPPFESLPHQDGLFGEASSSAQQSTILLSNQRAKSAKSLSGVVPAEEKKTSVENQNARPQLSSRLSPPAVCSPVIVADSKGFKASNSPSSAESSSKVEARGIKEPTAANPQWKKNSIVKIEVDEKLALETTEKSRLLITQNHNPLSFPRSKYLANVIVGLVMAFSIGWQMLHL